MDPNPLANIFKRPVYVETIASESALDYLYEVLLENHESKNCEIYKVIHDSSLNEKHDCYIVEFEYDPTCNHYERGKYGYRNFHVTHLPLLIFKLLMLHSSYLLMLDTSCLDKLFAYKMHMHRKYVRDRKSVV